MYSKVKLLGHPVHPMLVSYPIALYTSTFVAYLIYIVHGSFVWVDIAIAANVAGVVMAVIAAIPGFLDWAWGIPASSPAKLHGTIHMVLNVTALILFAVNAATHIGYWEFTDHPHSGLGIVLAALGVACTIAAGYYGWTMVQRDHVGVELSAEQQRLETTRVEAV
jgi:uncharacterized membrane protein